MNKSRYGCNRWSDPKYISNAYGELGEIGTIVHHWYYGDGIIVDDEGSAVYRKKSTPSYHEPNVYRYERPRKSVKFTFDRIITPIFTKDITELANYNYDIRQIFGENSMKESDYLPQEHVI